MVIYMILTYMILHTIQKQKLHEKVLLYTPVGHFFRAMTPTLIRWPWTGNWILHTVCPFFYDTMTPPLRAQWPYSPTNLSIVSSEIQEEKMSEMRDATRQKKKRRGETVLHYTSLMKKKILSRWIYIYIYFFTYTTLCALFRSRIYTPPLGASVCVF